MHKSVIGDNTTITKLMNHLYLQLFELYNNKVKTTKLAPVKRKYYLTTKQFWLVNNVGERPGVYIGGFNSNIELGDFIDNCNKWFPPKMEARGFRSANGMHRFPSIATLSNAQTMQQ